MVFAEIFHKVRVNHLLRPHRPAIGLYLQILSRALSNDFFSVPSSTTTSFLHYYFSQLKWDYWWNSVTAQCVAHLCFVLCLFEKWLPFDILWDLYRMTWCLISWEHQRSLIFRISLDEYVEHVNVNIKGASKGPSFSKITPYLLPISLMCKYKDHIRIKQYLHCVRGIFL